MFISACHCLFSQNEVCDVSAWSGPVDRCAADSDSFLITKPVSHHLLLPHSRRENRTTSPEQATCLFFVFFSLHF